MSYSSLRELKKAFSERGCKDLLIKPLAPNQDNEKNQIYLGYNQQLFSTFPGKVNFRAASSSRSKTNSSAGKSIIELNLQMFWLDEGHEPAAAPNAKIIDYFQYPEMRLSGFMSDCRNPPDALRRDHQSDYGRRALILGIQGDVVYATVATETENAYISELFAQPEWTVYSLFRSLKLNDSKFFNSSKSSSFEEQIKNSLEIDSSRLLKELGEIGGLKHPSTVMRASGFREDFRGPQGAGWTLESLLGIPRNSSGSPDKYGIELKTFLSSKITLLATEPDFGVRSEKGLSAFLNKFGWVGTKNDGSLRFNGKHTTSGIYSKSGLKLEIEHWDYMTNSPNGKGTPNVLLINPRSKIVAAGWTFEKLALKWARKHAGAMFIEAHKFTIGDGKFPSHYSFGPKSFYGIGTSPLLLMKGIASGLVYLDPGDRIDNLGQEKRRSQWRIDKGRNQTFGVTLSPLYDEMTTYEIS